MTGWLFGLMACSASPPDGPGAGSESSRSVTAGADDLETPGPSTQTGSNADEALARSVIDGTVDPREGLAAIAWSGGLPVETDAGTWIFLFEPEVGDAGAWSVAGDFEGWAGTAMTRGPSGVWWLEVAVEAPAGSGYKLTDGQTWMADPGARSFTYDENGELSYVRAPTDRWRLDRWPDRAGAGLAPRDLRIYVPPGTGPFPVLYAHDGQNLFDPAAFWGGWRMQDALAGVAPMLVVGLDNTADRFDEYTHVPDEVGYGPMGGSGDLYADFVRHDVRPFVEATYGSTGVDGVLGSSLGGLISLHIAQRSPEDWDFAASLSGTLGWGRFDGAEPVMEELWLDRPAGFTVVYLDSGGGAGPDGLCRDPDGDGFFEDDPDASDNYCETRGMADALAASGWTWNEDLVHWWEPGGSHDEAAWAGRVAMPLEIFASLAP